MKFFEDVHGALRPTSAITRIRRGDWNDSLKMRAPGEVTLTSGSAVAVQDYDIDAIVMNSHPIIPAHPGFLVLAMWGSTGPADQMFSDEWPVVAWRVNAFGDLDPMVPDHHFRGMRDNFAILYPDGKVVNPTDGVSFESRDEWETEMRERAAARSKPSEQ